MREKIALRQNSALVIQRYLRGWIVRKRVGYIIRVKRDLEKMTTELTGIRETYKNLPDYRSKGYANVSHQKQLFIHIFFTMDLFCYN